MAEQRLQELRRFPLWTDTDNRPKTFILAAGSVIDYTGDAFVNAANEGCVGGFGVDELVNQAGGFELKNARKELNGCATGDAKITPAFAHARTRWIIHAVGPVYRASRIKKKTEAELDEDLRNAYRCALRRAEEVGAETVGFCLLSCGVFRGERDLGEVIEIGMQSVVEELVADGAGSERRSCLREVTFVAYTDEEQGEACAVADKLLQLRSGGADGGAQLT